MTEKLDIDALRALRAIKTSGGVTLAAKHLCLSQSAVSHKVRRLEDALDCALLTRRKSGPLFTDAGERLQVYAERILSLHEEAMADLSKKQLDGAIRLGMTEDAAISDISQVLGRFSRLHPSVLVQTRSSQSLNVQAWLAAGELDVAMMQVFANEVEPTDQVLFSDTLHWVKSPDLELDLTKPIPFISFDPNCFYRQWGFAQKLGGTLSLETVFECPSAAGVQSSVRAGLGVALLNGLHLAKDIEVIEGLFPMPPEIVFVIRRHEESTTPAIAVLTDEISKVFGDYT